MNKKSFLRSGEGGLVNYSYEDIADGTGVQVMYGFSVDDNAVEDYILAKQTTFSNKLFTSGAASTAYGDATVLDLDFDLSAFNTPRTIKGTAYATVPWRFYNTTPGTTTSGAVTVKIRKVSNSVESEVASEKSGNQILVGSANKYYLSVIPITIPQTDYKIGDTLRVTIEGNTYQDNGQNPIRTIWLSHSPTNDDDGVNFRVGTDVETSTLSINIPFKSDT